MTFWDYLDRRSARAAAKPIDARLFANVLGAALIVGFIGAVVALFIVPIKGANKELLSYMLGQLSGFAGGIVAYHYTMNARQAALDNQRTETTGKLVDAVIASTGKTSDPTPVEEGAKT